MTPASASPMLQELASRSPLPGTRTMLIGPPGSGKTYALRTLADAGLDVRVIFTDPGMETIGDDPRIKWCFIPPATSSWAELISGADMINKMSNEQLQKLTSINPSGYRQFIDVLHACNDYKTQDGRQYGDVGKWSTGCVFVFDGLTGLSKQSMQLAIGSKPVRTLPDWGVAMDNLERFVDKLTQDLWCHFVLIAHIEREKDEITGGVKTMPSTLGQKLAPKLPVNFGDVVLAVKEGTTYTWSTADPRTDLKKRLLPDGAGQKPSFVPLIEAWKRKGGVIEPVDGKAPERIRT